MCPRYPGKSRGKSPQRDRVYTQTTPRNRRGPLCPEIGHSRLRDRTLAGISARNLDVFWIRDLCTLHVFVVFFLLSFSWTTGPKVNEDKGRVVTLNTTVRVLFLFQFKNKTSWLSRKREMRALPFRCPIPPTTSFFHQRNTRPGQTY